MSFPLFIHTVIAKCLAIHMEISLLSTSVYGGKMSWAEHKFMRGCICLRNNCYFIFCVHHLDQEFSCWIVTVTQKNWCTAPYIQATLEVQKCWPWKLTKLQTSWNMKCWKLLSQPEQNWGVQAESVWETPLKV